MSAGPITPGDTVLAYAILLSIGFLAVCAVVMVLLGLKWLGRDR